MPNESRLWIVILLNILFPIKIMQFGYWKQVWTQDFLWTCITYKHEYYCSVGNTLLLQVLAFWHVRPLQKLYPVYHQTSCCHVRYAIFIVPFLGSLLQHVALYLACDISLVENFKRRLMQVVEGQYWTEYNRSLTSLLWNCVTLTDMQQLISMKFIRGYALTFLCYF